MHGGFKPDRLSRIQIHEVADSVRREFWGSDQIPVDVEHIWEVALRKELRPKRGLSKAGAEACLLGLETIIVDEEQYFSRYRGRIRFSIAHEMGHFFLHRDLAQRLQFHSIKEWIEFYQSLADEDYKWLELQANMFAGRLLVPVEPLRSHAEKAWDLIKDFRDQEFLRTEPALDYVASFVAEPFLVNPPVISRRLSIEGLWPPPSSEGIV